MNESAHQQDRATNLSALLIRIAVVVPRVTVRLARVLAMTAYYYGWLLGVDMLAQIWPEHFEPKRRPIALGWLRQLQRSIGHRVSTFGVVPQGQIFLVSTHVTWQDFFLQDILPHARPVAMDPVRDMPILGRFFCALDCIFVSRKSEEVPSVNAEIRRRLSQGESVMIAPEGVVSPGRFVQRFHAALLEGPVQEAFPVHYCALHYHTPYGWPPPSQSVLFGPDPYFRTDEDEIPASQLEMWGPPRPFFPYFVKLLSLPYHRLNITFGDAPLTGTDRIE
ncbi:MAG: 1-acyl-sn-glycerol-3-phosphate acyltransferase, partial [Candidatus Hydrogenedentota bacterium]